MKRSPANAKTRPLPQDKPTFCTQCGTPNTKDSKFCKECGESLVTTYAPKISSDPFVQAGLGREDQIERLLDMAFWHNEAGNIGAALLACQAALALNDRSVSAWSLMGCLYEKKGDLDKAVEAFEVVVAINPDSIADSQKLEALRRGVHVKAVPQPVSYRWIPPALSRFVQERPTAPAVGAAGAGVAALLLGLIAIHPLFSASNRYTNADTPNLSASHSAWSSGSQGSVAQDITPTRSFTTQPMIASAQAPRTMSNVIAPAAATPRQDPFAGSGSQVANTAAVVSHPPQRHEPDQEASAKGLPPLSVANLPTPSDIHPILNGPNDQQGAVPAVQTPDVPQHTIPVTGFPADNAQPTPPDNNLPGENGAPPPASRISITVHGNSTENDGAEPVPVDPGPEHHLVLSQNSGANLQQTALTYQEQGNYSNAQAAYKRAIAAYQSDLDAGRDTDAAVRGIQACETGLQICRQSQ